MTTPLQTLRAACDSLAADGRYAKKTRALAAALGAWAATQPRGGLEVEIIESALRFDDVSLYSPAGRPFADLPAGCFILDAWVDVPELWDAAAATLNVVLLDDTDTPVDAKLFAYGVDLVNAESHSNYFGDEAAYSDISFGTPGGQLLTASQGNAIQDKGAAYARLVPLRLTAAARLSATVVQLDGTPTAGTATVYVLTVR
jgi:hypothetical protein